MTVRPDDSGIMTGAFALDAVDDRERADMDAALATSPELRSEVDSLRETALLLAYAVEPIEPPKDLKAALMAKIAVTPQRAAEPTHLASPAADAGQEARPASAPEPARADGGAASAPEPAVAGGGAASATARRRWFQRPAALISAAAAAVVLIGGGFVATGVVHSGTEQPGTTQAGSAQLDKIYAAADFQRSSVPVSGGGTATVVWSDDLAKSAVILKNVDAAPSGKTYELWYIGSSIKSAGLMNQVSGGVSTAVLTGTKAKGVTVGITVEPSGGSKQPTTKPIVAVPTTTA